MRTTFITKAKSFIVRKDTAYIVFNNDSKAKSNLERVKSLGIEARVHYGDLIISLNENVSLSTVFSEDATEQGLAKPGEIFIVVED